MSELEIEDPRVFTIAELVLQSFRQKPDKFLKPYGLEDVRKLYMDFFEFPDRKMLYISLTPAGLVSTETSWPSNPKSKGFYFVKRKPEPIPREAKIKKVLMYGEMSPSVVEHFSLLIDEVRNGNGLKNFYLSANNELGFTLPTGSTHTVYAISLRFVISCNGSPWLLRVLKGWWVAISFSNDRMQLIFKIIFSKI